MRSPSSRTNSRSRESTAPRSKPRFSDRAARSAALRAFFSCLTSPGAPRPAPPFRLLPGLPDTHHHAPPSWCQTRSVGLEQKT